MPDTNYGYEQETNQTANPASQTGTEFADTAMAVKDKTKELGRSAVNKIEEGRVSMAEALHSAATSLHSNASKLPNGPDLARSAAARMDAMSGYLQDHDTRQMMADVEAIVKRNPRPSLLIAGALGFLIGRSFMTNRRW